jgi:hypothetical protein
MGYLAMVKACLISGLSWWKPHPSQKFISCKMQNVALQAAAAVAGFDYASNQAGGLETDMNREALPMACLFICLAVLAFI